MGIRGRGPRNPVWRDNRQRPLGSGSEVSCLPAALGDRKDSRKHLICLLLQLLDEETGTFRRIGLTKISGYARGQADIRAFSGDEASMPCSWDAETGVHTIRII